MHVITADQIRKAVPNCKDPAGWAGHLNDAAPRYGIVEPRELAEFLAQCAHESQSFNTLTENLSYSAIRLMAVWPKRFPTIGDAGAYARNPVALANLVYANRMGNGPVASGDGSKYRGRGLIMVTGKANYAALEKLTGLPLVKSPELLAMPGPAALSACAWWSSRPNLRQLALDTSRDNLEAITRIVNGGTEGLADRAQFRAAFKSVTAP